MPAACEKIPFGVDTAERREFYRWEIPSLCRLRIEDSVQEASVQDISLGGVRLTGNFRAELRGRTGSLITETNGRREVACRVVHVAGSSRRLRSCGIGFEEIPLSREDFVGISRSGVLQTNFLQQNLAGFIEYLLARSPSLLHWSSEIPTERLLPIFDGLCAGRPLQPPDGFIRELELVADRDWEIASLLVSRWTQTKGEVLTESEAERMTQGLLWGTLLVKKFTVA